MPDTTTAAPPASNPHLAAYEARGLKGRIRVPGFYDDVDELPDEVRAQWQALAFLLRPRRAAPPI